MADLINLDQFSLYCKLDHSRHLSFLKYKFDQLGFLFNFTVYIRSIFCDFYSKFNQEYYLVPHGRYDQHRLLLTPV